MKRLILILQLSLVTGIVSAQVIYYRYDAAGNRKYRGPLSTAPIDGRKGLDSTSRLDSKYHIKVYPNPVGVILNIDIDGLSDTAWVYTIYNLNGSIMMSDTRHDARYSTNLAHLATGVYILKIAIGRKEEDYKIIKE